jgi:uncharacterized protein (TIGR03437 family)
MIQMCEGAQYDAIGSRTSKNRIAITGIRGEGPGLSFRVGGDTASERLPARLPRRSEIFVKSTSAHHDGHDVGRYAVYRAAMLDIVWRLKRIGPRQASNSWNVLYPLFASRGDFDDRHTLVAQSIIIGAGYSTPYPIKVAPGQLVTIFASGIDATLKSRVAATTLPLPLTLAGISVTIDELSNPPLLKEKVPILAVAPTSGTTAVTVQMLFFLRTSSFISPLIPPPATLTLYEDGTAVVTISIAPTSDQIHIATTCDANITIPEPGALCRPIIAHADGSLVTPDKPAHTGELLLLYAFGLGATNPGMAAGDAATSAQPVAITPSLSYEAAIPTRASERRSFSSIFAGLTVGFAGLYQINFFAPAPPDFFATDCTTFSSPNGNVALTVRRSSSDTASFCVFP